MSRPEDRERDIGFAQLFAEAERHVEFWEELAIVGFAEDVWLAMERQGLCRAELARKLGTSQAYVTKVLRGNANFTIRSMARLAMALDMELRVELVPKQLERARAIIPATGTLPIENEAAPAA
jgi:transcriptional regulator with XRE-family HTH domain